MKTLVLDMSKWRCGGNSDNPAVGLGKGNTFLLNREGYMCCLGQFAPQLNTEIKTDDMLDWSSPIALGHHIPLLTTLDLLSVTRIESEFTDQAIMINDDTVTSVEEKIEGLRNLLNTNNYQLEIINHI